MQMEKWQKYLSFQFKEEPTRKEEKYTHGHVRRWFIKGGWKIGIKFFEACFGYKSQRLPKPSPNNDEVYFFFILNKSGSR